MQPRLGLANKPHHVVGSHAAAVGFEKSQHHVVGSHAAAVGYGNKYQYEVGFGENSHANQLKTFSFVCHICFSFVFMVSPLRGQSAIGFSWHALHSAQPCRATRNTRAIVTLQKLSDHITVHIYSALGIMWSWKYPGPLVTYRGFLPFHLAKADKQKILVQ